MTRLTPHTQLSSNLVLYGQAHRRIKVCLQHPLADRLAQVAPAAAGTAALPLILLSLICLLTRAQEARP